MHAVAPIRRAHHQFDQQVRGGVRPDNRVQRLHEDPRVTLPYDAQWQRIWQLGLDVDAELEAGDVRLTMGGEPTFVSVDDQESAQWNTAADGEDKRVLAERLTRRLREAFAPGGLLHYGQGKWYPGEPLPLGKTCYWRPDGEPPGRTRNSLHVRRPIWTWCSGGGPLPGMPCGRTLRPDDLSYLRTRIRHHLGWARLPEGSTKTLAEADPV